MQGKVELPARARAQEHSDRARLKGHDEEFSWKESFSWADLGMAAEATDQVDAVGVLATAPSNAGGAA